MTEDRASWDTRLRQLERCRRERHPPSGLPGRRHIDPIEIGPALLPHVFLLQAEDRMVGARCRDDVACVCDRAAIRRKGAPASVQTRDYIVIDWILLPLATDGATVDTIPGASLYGHSRGRRP